ncbi:MAG: hypothetical protein ACOC2F_07990 [Bacteroidota bacterium]
MSLGDRVYAGRRNETDHAISNFQDSDLESDFIPKANGIDDVWNRGTRTMERHRLTTITYIPFSWVARYTSGSSPTIRFR